MSYRVVYDIATEPPFDIEMVWLSGGFILLGIIWRMVQRAKDRKLIDPPRRSGLTTPKVLIGFGVVIAAVGIGLMSWDHWRLLKAFHKGEGQGVEGPIQSWGTERVRTARTDRREYRTYERFYVGDSIWFGYYWETTMAGFYNQGSPRVAFHDGMKVCATYLNADGIVLFVLLAVFAGQIAPFDPFQGGQEGLKPPGSPGHLFDTNHIGQDILSQILYGARISLAVGVSAALSAS